MSKESEILVEARGVSKKFSRNLKRSLIYGLQDVAKNFLGIKSENNRLRKTEFWAVKDINFQLKRGECLGLIGHNGAGKSTLLKMLNGLIKPDEGEIVMRGRIGALIELGAGFNPVLTGRENIYINGQILGLTKKEIDNKLEAIIDFAEISEAIDSPVRNYSSGMKVRLGFAVAAQMEPDVLIIDEVLAVGDLGFTLKCLNSMDTMLPKTAIIFVSHSMPLVSRMCSQIMLMQKGGSSYIGSDVAHGIDLYYAGFKSNTKQLFSESNKAKIANIRVLSDEFNESETPMVRWAENLKISFSFFISNDVQNFQIAFTVFDKEQRAIAIGYNNEVLSNSIVVSKDDKYTQFESIVNIENNQLSKGIYSITFTIYDKSINTKVLLKEVNACFFQVLSEIEVWPPIHYNVKWE